jgi:arylsulfatase A-like enzyme
MVFPDGFGAGRRVTRVARQVDVLPTLLDYLGEEVPDSVQGRSLLPLVQEVPDDTVLDTMRNETVPAQANYAYLRVDHYELESVTFAGRKLIDNISVPLHMAFAGSPPAEELYDLRTDPAEKHNLVEEKPVWKGFLLSLLRHRRAFWPAARNVENAEVDETLRKTLKALGYID